MKVLDKETGFTNACCMAFDEIKTGAQFYAREVKERLARIRPASANCYIDSVMRVIRDKRRFNYKCLDKKHGLYIKLG